jgi:hypothetical protein
MKKIIYAAAISFISLSARAQNFGVATSNWSGMSSLYLNPANIADSKHKYVINVFSVGAGVDNNVGSLNTKGGLISAINNGNTKDIFNYGNSSRVSVQAPYAEITGPGAMISINNKHSIALTTRIRGMNQFNNFDRSLFQTVTDPNFSPSGNIDLTSQHFNYTAHVWSEVGLSYGGVIIQDANSVLKGGITLRYLGGIGYVGLRGNNLDAHYDAGSSTFYASNSDVQYASNVLTTNNALNNGFNNNSIASQFFGSKAGMGIGADLGLVYEFTPDNRRGFGPHNGTGYLVRLSGSVLDLGSIKYKAANNSNASVTGNGYITADGIVNNVRSYDDFKNYVVNQGFNAVTTSQDTRVYMPTRLLLSADLNVYSNLYVNAAFVGNLTNPQNYGNSYYDQLTVTPRFDTRWVSVGLPITYSSLSGTMKAGLGLRVSGFFVGSDDMLALVAKKQYGFNFYMGGFVPLNKHHWLDTDNDGVPDYRDGCPSEPGSEANKGCPDDDHGSGGEMEVDKEENDK